MTKSAENWDESALPNLNDKKIKIKKIFKKYWNLWINKNVISDLKVKTLKAKTKRSKNVQNQSKRRAGSDRRSQIARYPKAKTWKAKVSGNHIFTPDLHVDQNKHKVSVLRLFEEISAKHEKLLRLRMTFVNTYLWINVSNDATVNVATIYTIFSFHVRTHSRACDSQLI